MRCGVGQIYCSLLLLPFLLQIFMKARFLDCYIDNFLRSRQIINKKIQMSFLIEAVSVLMDNQTNQAAELLEFCNSNKQTRSCKGNQEIIYLQKTFQNRNEQLIQFWADGKRIQLFFLLCNLHKDLTYILKATINLKNFQLKFQLNPLNFDISNYLRISSCQRRVLAEKSIYMLNKLRPKLFNQLKISVEPNMGIIKIQAPIHYHIIRDIFELPKKVKSFITMFQQNVPKLYQPLLNLIELTNQSPHKYAQELFLKTEQKLKETKKYLKFLNIAVNIGAEDASQYRSFTKQTFNQQQSLIQINKNLVRNEDQFKSTCLYFVDQEQMFGQLEEKAKVEEICLNEAEREKFLKNLQINKISQMRQSNQRKFIVNQIKLVKPFTQSACKKVNQGGFSDIYQDDVYFEYLEPQSQYKSQQRSKHIHKRLMIVKAAKPNAILKIRHQKEVLLKLKSALAIFVPRYYFPPEGQTKENLLFIQHISTQAGIFDLEKFSESCKPTLSVHTKMWLGLCILQGLRFLKDYQIVHLDLKPSNIMIGKKLDLKFIDFGQSYHPSFKEHLPGTSMPYSSPESYHKTKDFTFKSDVFSFGVIMYNLLTSKHPFYVYSDKEREKTFLSISERWFFTPQALYQYGQTSIFPYILLLLGKCLSLDPKSRPQLQWLTLIFRQYIYFY